MSGLEIELVLSLMMKWVVCQKDDGHYSRFNKKPSNYSLFKKEQRTGSTFHIRHHPVGVSRIVVCLLLLTHYEYLINWLALYSMNMRCLLKKYLNGVVKSLKQKTP